MSCYQRFKQEGCFLYSSIGEPIEFADSVSGPKSCTCSEEYACSANEDNEIDFVFGVVKVKILIVIKFQSEYVPFLKESDCQDLCQQNQDCQVYTW